MNIEVHLMPRIVYAAMDDGLPCWQFVMVLANRSKDQWRLAQCRLSPASNDPAEAIASQVGLDGVTMIQAPADLAPGGVRAITIRDPYPAGVHPRAVQLEYTLIGPESAARRDSVSIPLVYEPTMPLDFALEGRWVAANARGDLHGAGIAFAYDFVTERDWNLHQGGVDKLMEPADFDSFGRPVYSPADGEIVSIESSQPDLACSPAGPPTLEKTNPSGKMGRESCGNYAIVRTADGKYVLLAHMKQGSLKVARGQEVAAGQMIGSVGNSGNTTGAHLHIEVLDGLPQMAHLGTTDFRQSGMPFGFCQRHMRLDGNQKSDVAVFAKGQLIEAHCRK
jgi:hypothetical protein